MQDFSHGIWNVIQNFMHSRIKVIKTKYQISYRCNKLCNQFSILNITKYKKMFLRKFNCYVCSRNWKILISNPSWTYTLHKCKSFYSFQWNNVGMYVCCRFLVWHNSKKAPSLSLTFRLNSYSTNLLNSRM